MIVIEEEKGKKDRKEKENKSRYKKYKKRRTCDCLSIHTYIHA